MAVTDLGFLRLAGEFLSAPGFPRANREEDDLDRVQRISHLKVLAQTIEGEIIPRLMMTFAKQDGYSFAEDSAQSVDESDIKTFGVLLLSGDTGDCLTYIELLRAKGVPLGIVFLGLFAPAARWLGQLWAEDLRSFAEVTIALGTLQKVFRHYSARFEEAGTVPSGRRAFLVPAPGEQHTFGLFVIETFLHRAGWQVDTLPAFDADEVRRYLTTNTVQLIGISLSCERFLEGASSAITTFRQQVEEHDVVVMAGGALFHSQPKLVEEIGANATANDAKEAVRKANSLVPWPIGDELRRRIN